MKLAGFPNRPRAFDRARLFLIATLLALVPMPANAGEPVVGGPCEECESVYVQMPAEIPSVARIAPPDEAGTPLRIEGTVRDRRGKPVEGVIVYAYHTNAKGRYPSDKATKGTSAQRHGRLRGWARSDSAGRYGFETIRPGGYPFSRDPQHIHMHIIEPGRCTYYIDDLLFAGDPRLTAAKIARLSRGRGGPGITQPTRNESGVFFVQRDIVLGAKIPGYPE